MVLKVLVTDGPNKNTLAILRDLGKEKEKYQIDITSAFHSSITLSSYSRYCRKTHYINSVSEDMELYAQKLLNIVERNNYDVLLPVGLSSYLSVSKYRDDFSKHVRLVVPNWEQMKIAFNKDRTMKFAAEHGLSIPKTKVISTREDLKDIDKFPIVMKSSDGFLRYCGNEVDLIKNFQYLKINSKTNIIIQEYVKGFGCGFYGVYSHGKLVAHFMHKRIKEFPVTGGPSAIAESYYDRRLFYYGKKLCDALEWHGPVMVEFKYDIENDDYKLIEVNPKLWGSLDLTIAAGVDVPRILVDIAMGKEPEAPKFYKNVRYKWLFPDEFWALVSDFSKDNLKDFLSLTPKFDGSICTNFYPDDMLPFLIQFMRALVQSPRIIIDRKRKFPHGVVVNK